MNGLNHPCFGRAVASAAALLPLIQVASALPPYTTSVLYRSGNIVTGVGQINSPFFPGFNGGEGLLGLAVNNAGSRFVHLGIFANPGFDEAILDLPGGASVPFLAAGVETPLAGSLTVPAEGYVLSAAYSTSINNNGDGAFVVALRPGEFSMVVPITGVLFNKTAMPISEGGAVTAPGVAPGSTFAAFNSSSVVHITDGNLLLLGTRIIEAGVPRNAILKVQLDSAGAVVSQSLVAKEGGPAGGGGDTWATVSVGPHTCAINTAGSVVHSGVTAAGVNGVFINGVAVAQQGGVSAIAGLPWGPLAGAPVDINGSGAWALRGVLNGEDFWNEQGEAGETFTSGGGGTTGNVTIGGGPMSLISGQLANDHDVDVYYLAIGDVTQPMQEAFSLTTVPDPGSGFAGAPFDSVVHLFRDFANANGAFRVGVGRSDNVAAGVPQSALTVASLPNDHVPGTKYFLSISTPRSRALSSGTSAAQMWQDDPGSLAITGGKVYWIDPSEGQIARASITTGALEAPLQVGVIPPQTVGQVAEDAPILPPRLAAYDAGAASKLYFIEQRFFPTRLKRCNPDGTGIETVRDTDAAGPSVSATATLVVDSVNGRVWWSRPELSGTINNCALDGSDAQTVLVLDETRATALAVDGLGGKFYFYEPVANSLNRANLDGTGGQILLIGANVRSMATDVLGRRLYLTTNTGAIRRIDLNTGLFIADLLASNVTPAAAVDPATGTLYWADGPNRRIRRSGTVVPAVEEWLTVGPDIGERPADGPGYFGAFGSWQRSGSPSGGPLPYQIRLTGATFVNPLAVIARSGVKVALAGEALPSTFPDPLTGVGATTSPVKISDNGAIAWRGRWTSTLAPTGTRTGVFINREEVFRDTSPPTAGGGTLATVPASAYAFDMSANGRHMLASAFSGSFVGINGNSCVQVTFSAPPGCQADFNGSGLVTVQDIFDFLTAYFSNLPAADINGGGSVTVQDIFDFLGLYFLGCS